MYRAETEEEGKEALRKFRERWETIYPRVVARWETKAYALLAFLRHKPAGAREQERSVERRWWRYSGVRGQWRSCCIWC